MSPTTASCRIAMAPVSVVDLALLLASEERLGSPFPALGLHCLICETPVLEDSLDGPIHPGPWGHGRVCSICVTVLLEEQLVFIVNYMPGVLQNTITSISSSQ